MSDDFKRYSSTDFENMHEKITTFFLRLWRQCMFWPCCFLSTQQINFLKLKFLLKIQFYKFLLGFLVI